MDNGISISITSGAPVYDMSKGARYDLSLVLNAKHTDQKLALDALSEIHELLTSALCYPTTPDGCQITSIETIYQHPHILTGRLTHSGFTVQV